jgi:hypothetical protein
MELILKGKQGKTLRVSGDVIHIDKSGLFTGTRSKTIAISKVSSVEVKKPGAFVGFIQFSISGGKARDSSFTATGGAFDAVQDENSVVFNGNDQYQLALRIKDYVESCSSSEHSALGANSGLSAADEIRQLKSLLDDGLITQEEFELKKRQLLGL